MIINLTPHSINYIHADGKTTVIPSSGIARASQTTKEIGESEGFRIVETAYGAPVDLPEYSIGVQYIVSALTVSAAKAYGRTTNDLLLVADTVRNDQGQIIGCKAFARV